MDADVAFARAFERLEIPPDDFSHRAHLRLAWVYLNESATTEVATAKMTAAIQRFAASAGKPEKYSAEITVLWMERLAAARRSMPDAPFVDLLAAYPGLLDSRRQPSQ